MRRPGSILGLLVILAILELADSNRCLTMREEVNPKRVVHLQGQSLNIPFELTRRSTQRLATRIMRIFLVEVLGYPGITLLERDDHFDATTVFHRMSDTVSQAGYRVIPETMVNMEVWVPPQEDTMPLLSHYDVKECGSVTSPGRFGWFVPEGLIQPGDSWRTFVRQETASRFDVEEHNLWKIEESTIDPTSGEHYCRETFCDQGMYIPERCKSQSCGLLLADDPDSTDFVKSHIDELELYVKVAWVGPNLKTLMKALTKEYLQLPRNGSDSSSGTARSLVVLHWTPSSVIPNAREFVSLEFPRCGSRGSDVGCKYESNRLVKLAWSRLEIIAKFAWKAINRANFNSTTYEDLIERYNRLSKLNMTEEEVACGWLRDNLNYTLDKWMPDNSDRNSLLVGGIFPMTGTLYTATSIVAAAKMAKDAINANNTLLRDYSIKLSASDGQCKSDMVMKSFIDYIANNVYEELIGVLGPACSETVEPLIGVSKHYKTVIISYSAEGSSFNDRIRYPYFFRTVGENKQYKHVYLKLLQSFGWKRVASLTEDGQKYTEYISYMQEILRDNGISFIANIKFPRDRERNAMTKYLQDLKQKRARIIIADVYDVVARQVMCEAYKLEMTAYQGYVWFLTLWLHPRWYDTDYYNAQGENVPCSTVEMARAINGHLGVSNAYFAPDNDIMQEGITVRQWRDNYEKLCSLTEQPPSNYAGYAYDAMWTYAYAMDLLLKENQSYVFDLHSDHTVNRLTDIIAATDFNGDQRSAALYTALENLVFYQRKRRDLRANHKPIGDSFMVSGRIKFLGGPSRVSVITVVQNIDNETRTIGNFYPNVSETKNEVIGGTLDLNKTAIVWLSKVVPNDGSEPPVRCVLAGLAELLDVTCEVAIVIANIIGFGLLGAVLITGFIIVKRKYDEKVRQHEKVMESFGLDPRQTTYGLDKWEIPRDRVVINRKLGEGAFGTVYGGETFFPEKGWLAVAVKTLKAGSSTDEKLDFLSEVEVMKRFEHKNIIRLLGVCIKSAPVLTVMEFMLYGDLKTYLLARRHLVNDQSYEDSDEISNKKLTAMALDVARALSYLAQLKYVHRDVASRNCLVNAARVVKLGDFGMTRPMYENDYYRFNRKGMLPVRWMAPESLGLGIFTPASDVWSYGVLLYEIITFGSFPFQGMSNNEVLAYVKAGNSLVVPKGVKSQLEGLIRSCWTVDHTNRPTAPEIVDFLATNPRLLSPCLDVPLASVQLENTGQMDFQLPESIRKYSMSLSWPPQQQRRQNSSPLAAFNSDNPTSTPLVDINLENEINGNLDVLLGVRNGDQDISLPLLPDSDSRYIQLQDSGRTPLRKRENFPKYVNIQPGEETTRENSDIQLEEKSSMLTKRTGNEPEDDSFL